MDDTPGELKTWKTLRKQLTSISEVEQEAVSQMARLVNEITRRRKNMGLTQSQVAQKAGITQAQVARLENSHSIPSMETVLKVAIALDIKLGFEEQAASNRAVSHASVIGN